MPEIFRFTQLREPSGINIEEVRKKHIQFFNGIEAVQLSSIHKAFEESFHEGENATRDYLVSNQGFIDRTAIPYAVIRKSWESPLNASHAPYFELSYLLSQYNSDKKEAENSDLFTQISSVLKSIDANSVQESIDGFTVYFGDLLVLYFQSSSYPSYLRLLIGLRRWHYVFSNFSLDEINDAFSSHITSKETSKDEVEGVLHFLLNARILLPKYLFKKKWLDKPKDNPNSDPIKDPIKDPKDVEDKGKTLDKEATKKAATKTKRSSGKATKASTLKTTKN